MNRLLAIFAVLTLLTLNLVLSGCGPSSSTATLMSIVVSPAAPSVAIGTTKQFSAMGVYSDNTTKDISSSVSWGSSDITKATIAAAAGLATGVATGTTTITATSGSISGNTVLTVTQPTTYTYTGHNYTNVVYSCGGACTDYTTSMKLTGSFTTSEPLTANLVSTNINSLIQSYSFNDGVNTINSTDPRSRLDLIRVSTNAAGNISSWGVVLNQWVTAGTPHSVNDRDNYIYSTSTEDTVYNNTICSQISTYNGVEDSCTQYSMVGGGSVYAYSSTPGTWN